ncbi:MAG: HAMP domain-containing protein [Alphaproteobacteria bacterium]|nr:HAMP domain-containing protein [Alphaproteobacteria bacterium]
MARLRTPFHHLLHPYSRAAGWLANRMPKALFTRALIIIIAPMVLLQSVVAYVFMERHWQLVTRRLSAAVVRDVGSVIDVMELSKQHALANEMIKIAGDRMGLDIEILPAGPLPMSGARPFFSILDSALSDEIDHIIKRPYWIDTVGSSDLIEIRVQLDWGILRVLTQRSQAYASNTHIFILWMVGTSLVLLLVAILFLRNQIKPVLQLAEAAESFGKGRDIDYRPRGAKEVRQAGMAFLEMKRRIERALEQRTAMLNGVSHDLRTILTRFRLSLEMSEAEPVSVRALLDELKADGERQGHPTTIDVSGDPMVTIRRDAIKRCLVNLVNNAVRHGDKIALSAVLDGRWLLFHIDDDGPGIPESRREEVFKPFVRLDEARNIDEGGSGLGLSIARDIVRAHGGDVMLVDSPMGGLRATVRIPV